jgi:hypothetical protein
MRLVRDLGRRKLRSTLTITGIAIGIMALVVFGSMANKMNALIGGGSKYYADKDIVSIGSMYSGNIQPLSLATCQQDREGRRRRGGHADRRHDARRHHGRHDGHARDDHRLVPGGDKGSRPSRSRSPRAAKLTAADAGKGHRPRFGPGPQAQRQRRRHGHPAHESSPSSASGAHAHGPGQGRDVPLAAAQELFVKSLPPLIQSKHQRASDIATGIVVYPKAGVDPETSRPASRPLLGKDYTVMTGKDFDAMLGSISAIFSDGPDRRRDAQPARRRPVDDQHDGHVRGRADPRDRHQASHRRLPLAHPPRDRPGVRDDRIDSRADRTRDRRRMTILFNDLGRASGNVLFDLTLGTALTAIGFSTGLGAIAGFVPAWHASRLDPVTALRYE